MESLLGFQNISDRLFEAEKEIPVKIAQAPYCEKNVEGKIIKM